MKAEAEAQAQPRANAKAKADLPVIGRSACELDPDTGRCSTCADEGLEGRIVALREDGLADVELDGQVREVAVELLEAAAVGDVVLVHAGVAIARVAPGEES